MNGNDEVSLTKEGYDELVVELAEVKEKKLPAAIERVKRARDFGDLSENSEYHSARDDLSFLEGRIEELESLIVRAKIIKTGKSTKAVTLGSKVTVRANGQTHTYFIVGEYEADPTEKKISHESPLGRALIGKKVGEKVEFVAPVGKILYEIKKID
ncbi:transcription elongation factor GreA [Microgenomates group bacterium RIFCSPLOWO2_01_FULL_46_13]|nr:MAG: transcription elongation factor GreA [Microgenomates group bacterium RIFCSPHIGHO2_01_FULL_45_11]OGV94926.1 MAG: transcription elongation factor GreA [Microgenomates group bacterium RIFCSPLOWO2_01_FULL_46_13]